MARPNRRGRYYNYPNLRTDMNKAPVSESNQEEKATAQELHAMNEMNGAMNQQQGTTYDGRTAAQTRTNLNDQDNVRENDDRNDNTEDNHQDERENREDEGSCKIRFFNAAAGYGGLEIVVAGQMISNNLPFGHETTYTMVPDGFQQVTITMVQDPEATLLNKRMPFRNCMNTTAAIVNTSTGIEIMMINDTGCRIDESDRACFRVANLSYTSPPLDIVLENGNPVFEDVRFKNVTEYKQAVPGEYNFNVMVGRMAETVKNNTVDIIMPEIPVEEGGYPGEVEQAYAYFFEDFEEGERYTAYIIGNKDYEPPLRVETLIEKE